jgi:cupin 2 domain-containing protein
MNGDDAMNIFANLPDALPDEVIDALAETANVRIERIVSNGQATAEGEWYGQERDEWVLLLTGSAGLLMEGEGEPHILKPGDYLMIPAHCRHRVAWTDPGERTVWLAVHMGG